MYRTILLSCALMLAPAAASTVNSAPATYIMQLSSNLGCDRLDIALVSQAGKPNQLISFSKGAYAAAQLPAGPYTFGEVTCMTKGNLQTFDLLTNKVAPLNLMGGQTYYGGRMIFQETSAVDVNATPDVLDNCTQVMSGARGEGSNECRDGTGVKTTPIKSHQINVYIPDVTSEDLNTLRAALSASSGELVYLPLKV